MAERFERFLDDLGTDHRVLLQGGLAMIAHGLSRPTKDGDVWLEPMASPERWSQILWSFVGKYSGASIISLLTREALSADELPEVIANDRVVRICGLSDDLDVFRVPNNLEAEDFEEVWNRALPWSDCVRVMDPLDLMVTKLETGRTVDHQDVQFLEEHVRELFTTQVRAAAPDEASGIFARYADHEVCRVALENPHAEVRAMALDLLREFERNGDPFARDILRDWDAGEGGAE